MMWSASVRAYWRSSSRERLLARRALRTMPHESEDINRAAVGWALSTSILIVLTAAVVFGFAMSWAVSGQQQAIPLFLLAAIEVYSAVRMARRGVEFRRQAAGPSPHQSR